MKGPVSYLNPQGPLANPPAISVPFVTALAHLELLLDVDAVGVVPEE